MSKAIRQHWREYLAEAACLGLFMLAAGTFGVLLEHPASPVHRTISNASLRRFLMGIAMGSTAIALIHSPWGKRSGAHMNPSITLAFWSLGKIRRWDALFYMAAQFAGSIAGIALASALIGPPLGDLGVNYVVTAPGPWGEPTAFFAEFLISLVMMLTVLGFANSRALSRFTPFAAGLLVAAYIAFEAPYSGMSMNPARTLGSATGAGDYRALWIYFVAPPAAMFLAGRLFLSARGAHGVLCAKLHHHNHQPCIFHCHFQDLSNL